MESENSGCLRFFIIWLVVTATSGILGGFCWTYAINEWLVYAGKAPVLVFWQGALIGCVPYLGQLSIPVATLTFIAQLFL